MAINPVEHQVIIPRTSELSKVQNDTQQRNLATQQQQAGAVQQKASYDIRQVHSQEKAQNARISDRQEKKQQEKGRQGKKGQGGTKSGKGSEGPGNSIDIRI